MLWHICKPMRKQLLNMEDIKCTDATVDAIIHTSKAIIITAAIAQGL